MCPFCVNMALYKIWYYCYYTPCLKKLCRFFCQNFYRFQLFLVGRWKIVWNFMWCIHIPPHLILVATLPCKTQKFEISAQQLVCDSILYTNPNVSARQFIKLLILNTVPSEFIKKTLNSLVVCYCWSKMVSLKEDSFWSPRIEKLHFCSFSQRI